MMLSEALKKDQRCTNEALHRLLLPLKNQTPPQLFDAMTYALLAPGKRFRAFLCLEVGRRLNISEEQLLPLACAIEMVHCYSLIHDDLPAMDNADLRRGRPSVHKKFDEATAILAGNALQSLAFETMASETVSPHSAVRCRLVRDLAKAIGAQGMMAGQILDLQGEALSYSFEEVRHMEALKTGALIAFSVTAPASLKGLEASEIDQLSAFAELLGLAFQVTDDVLDVEQNSAILGKPSGADDRRQKSTFVSLLTLERAKTFASELIEAACKHLKNLSFSAPLLEETCYYILRRDR